MNSEAKKAQFWEIAHPLLETGQAERGTMMGFPCLRVGDKFCTSLQKDTSDLIVKLPATRVLELIANGDAKPFNPNGRTFKEWAQITTSDAEDWEVYLHEAIAFSLASAPSPR